MKRMAILLCAMLTVTSVALAVPASKTLEFDKSPQGTVTFSGKVHADQKIGCKECHNKEMFPQYKKGTVEIKMDKIYAGQLCGKCHNGERAFNAQTNCVRCHKK